MSDDRPDSSDDGISDQQRSPTEESTVTELSDVSVPSRIGPYRILQKLGEGGMGVVYEAEQESPVRRRVALKIVKWGMDSKQVIARFEAERQALALMNHANVAKVFDAGAMDQGRPYFVMELVQGIPITEHCDQNRLTTAERLSLFMQVCEGLQHAHQKGIIHRDIKPSNILVEVRDGKAVPKVIDFGVAKATEYRLTERTLFTELGQLVGTPEYMSPEQAEMSHQDIDTRTDVYSLGVVLYELLVGVPPFDLKGLRRAGFDEIRRRIREEEPSKPSTRLKTLENDFSAGSAKRHSVDVSALERQLRGDLDWITLKTLEKDRTRRYSSPNELAADIRRHLKHEPVLAGPPSAAYRMGKFVRRHRVSVTAATLVAATLVLGTIGTTVGFVRSVRAERLARDEAERANLEATTSTEVSDFLVALFEVSDPSEARGNTITAREILDRGVESIETQLADQPVVQARMLTTMGRVYRSLGLLDPAKDLLERALSTHEKLFGPEHPLVATDLEELASVHGGTIHVSAWKEAAERSLAIRRKALDPKHPDLAKALVMVAGVALQYGQRDRAESLLLEGLQIQEEVLEPDHPDLAPTIYVLGVLALHRGRLEEARAHVERALRIHENHYGIDHPDNAVGLERLAQILGYQHRFEEAEVHLRRALKLRESVQGPDHIALRGTAIELAKVLMETGRLDEAEALLERAVRLQSEPRNMLWEPLWLLVQIQCKQGDRTGSELAMDRFLNSKSHEDDPDYWHAKYHALLGDTDAALRFLEQAVDRGLSTPYLESEPEFTGFKDEPRFKAVVRLAASQWLESKKQERGEDDPETLSAVHRVALIYQRQELHEEAESLFREAMDKRRRILGRDHVATLASQHGLAATLAGARVQRYEDAEPLYLETIEARKRVLGDDHSDTLLSMNGLAALYTAQGRYSEAESLFLEMLDYQRPEQGENHPDTARTVYNLACLEALRGDHTRALERLRQSAEAGWIDADWMAKDPDLEPLHSDPEFEAIVAGIRKRLGED